MTGLSWKQTLGIMCIILCFGVGIRAYGLGNNSFSADEFLDMNSAYGYFKTGEWKAWDFNHQELSVVNLNEARDERANIYKWQVAQLFRFLPPTEAVARSVSVVWGGITLLVVFWSAWVLTKRREIALLAALLAALSVSEIVFDRRLRMYAMFAPAYLALATVLFLCLEQTVSTRWRLLQKFWERTGVHIGYALLSGILLVIGLLIHQLTATIIFSVAAYLLWAGMTQYRATRNWWNRYLVLLGLLGLILVSMRIVAESFFSSFVAGLIWFDNHYSYLGYVMRDYAHPLLALGLMGFGAYGLAMQERRPKAAGYLVFSFIIPLACAMWFFRRNAGPQYIFFAQSFELILTAAGMFGLWQSLREHYSQWSRKTALIIFFGLFLLVPNLGYFLEANNTYHETSSGENPNYRKVFNYVVKNRLPTDVLVTRNVRNYYWSGADIRVYDLGDEINREKLSLDALERIVRDHESGWVILSDNDYDYVSQEAEWYVKGQMERVSNPSVRGPIEVYRFGHQE
ncbi:MAG: hypothetical protein KA054_01345 [Candidatus Moranbacteria bacterium]|nr:hypothetical protein [Candidatus Moranbacteria bacterium]